MSYLINNLVDFTDLEEIIINYNFYIIQLQLDYYLFFKWIKDKYFVR